MTPMQRLEELGRTADELLAEIETSGGTPEEVLTRWEQEASLPAAHLATANVWCGLKPPGIKAVHRLGTEPPLWELVGEAGTSRATTAQLAEWRTAKVKIAEATGQVPIRRVKWDNVWRALTNAAEGVEMGGIGSDAGLAREWIGVYLDQRGCLSLSLEEALVMRGPYFDTDGTTICIFTTDLLKWLRMVLHERIDAKQLAVVMRGAGVPVGQVSIRADNRKRRTTTNVYRVPAEVHLWDATS